MKAEAARVCVRPAGARWYGCVSLNPQWVVWACWRWRWLSNFLFLNRAVESVGFLWFWCARHYAPLPQCSALLIWWLLSSLQARWGIFTSACYTALFFSPSFDWTGPVSIRLMLVNFLFIQTTEKLIIFFQIFTSRLKKFTSTTSMPTLHNTFIIFALSPVTYLQPDRGGMLECCLSLLNLLVIGINDRLHSWGICVIPRVFTNRFRYDPLTEPADIYVMEA